MLQEQSNSDTKWYSAISSIAGNQNIIFNVGKNTFVMFSKPAGVTLFTRTSHKSLFMLSVVCVRTISATTISYRQNIGKVLQPNLSTDMSLYYYLSPHCFILDFTTLVITDNTSWQAVDGIRTCFDQVEFFCLRQLWLQHAKYVQQVKEGLDNGQVQYSYTSVAHAFIARDTVSRTIGTLVGSVLM